jgi:hypothetical protein
MAEFRALRSDFERMLHLRARTFAPFTPCPGYRIDIARKNPSVRQKKKDTAPQANIPHDFGTPIKRGKASGLLDSNGCCCYDTHIACV